MDHLPTLNNTKSGTAKSWKLEPSPFHAGGTERKELLPVCVLKVCYMAPFFHKVFACLSSERGGCFDRPRVTGAFSDHITDTEGVADKKREGKTNSFRSYLFMFSFRMQPLRSHAILGTWWMVQILIPVLCFHIQTPTTSPTWSTASTGRTPSPCRQVRNGWFSI